MHVIIGFKLFKLQTSYIVQTLVATAFESDPRQHEVQPYMGIYSHLPKISKD